MEDKRREGRQQDPISALSDSLVLLTPLAEAETAQPVRSATMVGLALLVLGAGLATDVIPFPHFFVRPLSPLISRTDKIGSTVPSASMPKPNEVGTLGSNGLPMLITLPAPQLTQPTAEIYPQSLLRSSLAGLLQPVQASDVDGAINGMWFGEPERARLRIQVADGAARVAWIVLSDWDAEDGDSVTVSAAGYSQFVRLYHRPTTLAVPYRIGEPLILMGAFDGDNRGITVAVHAGGTRVPLSMRLGETIQVPTP